MMKEFTSNIASSLPQDMLAEILKHAASNSITDFVNMGLSCKDIHGASKYEDQIFKNVSMKKYSLVPWCKRDIVFQKKCEVAKNVEALYTKGMLDYFSIKKHESGLFCLKKASEKGHVEAVYAYGIVLICLGGEQREKGLQLLLSLGKKSSRIIVGYRSKKNKFLNSMWIRGPLNMTQRIDCNCDKGIKERSNPWEGETSEVMTVDMSIPQQEASSNFLHVCASCFWNREATLLCNVIIGNI